METGISVVMCCYNSASRLSETLKHLAAQKTPENFSWEIVLVDNASTDATKETALKLWRELDRKDVLLKIVDQPIQGLSFARAKGVDESKYSLVLFCDDDNWLQSNYVADAYAILNSDPQIGALGGTGFAVADSALPAWFGKYSGCYACYPQGDREGELLAVTSFLYGAGLVVRKETLKRLSAKGFKPILPDRIGTKLTSGGDTELSYAIRLVGYKLWFSEKLKFSHYLPASRLTENYLYKLISSMSYCSGTLITYNYVLAGKSIHGLVWLKDAAYQLLFFSKVLMKYLLGGDFSFERKLDFAFSYNRMRSIFQQAGTYSSRYRQILKLKE